MANVDLEAALERISATARQAVLRSLSANTRDFALTGHWRPDSLRTVRLFGKKYWWDRLPDGRLTLERAYWSR